MVTSGAVGHPTEWGRVLAECKRVLRHTEILPELSATLGQIGVSRAPGLVSTV